MSTSVAVPVQELPHLPGATVGVLKRTFNVTVSEWVLLFDCQRDDVTKFALDPRHVTPAQRPALNSLREKAYIEYSVHTGKWELTGAGQAVVTVAPLVVKNVRIPHHENAEVIIFPHR